MSPASPLAKLPAAGALWRSSGARRPWARSTARPRHRAPPIRARPRPLPAFPVQAPICQPPRPSRSLRPPHPGTRWSLRDSGTMVMAEGTAVLRRNRPGTKAQVPFRRLSGGQRLRAAAPCRCLAASEWRPGEAGRAAACAGPALPEPLPLICRGGGEACGAPGWRERRWPRQGSGTWGGQPGVALRRPLPELELPADQRRVPRRCSIPPL